MESDVLIPHFSTQLTEYVSQQDLDPLFLCGSGEEVLQTLPESSFDFCMTSPPYWGKRQYANGGIGLEDNYEVYIENLLKVIEQIHRVLKPTGSFWLNIGDSYKNKHLLGIPWQIALEMRKRQGWVLRNQVVWNKVKGGPCNSKDKLRNIHEPIFHFVKQSKGYYYNADAIRTTPRKAQVINGAIVSATGVSGVRYRRQIELSTALSDDEKKSALHALDNLLDEVRQSRLADFRMIIRGQQRTTHSDSESVSGRARDLKDKGFYFLRYHPKGSKPSDVWDILPEDSQKRKSHFAPYPSDLCRIPMLATCPENGIVLDPFCGTGTTNLVARQMGRKSVGIDVSNEYLDAAIERCRILI